MILFASPFNKKAKQWIEGRRKWEEDLAKKIKKGENWIWFHCSSLGEFEDSCEIFFKTQKDFPSKKTILTVFSPSAYIILKQSNLFDVTIYLPLDTKANAEKFVNIVQPELVLFSRSELWLNFLLKIKEREIPIFLISLKLSNKSNFIKWPFNIFYRKCFNAFNFIFCQNSETQELLYSYFNISNSLITGNTRFERVTKQSHTNKIFPEIETYVLNCFVIVIGSCLPKDEKKFLEIYKDLKMLNIKWIIVPHEIEKSIITKKINSKSFLLYSNIKNINSACDILIIDTVGILKHIYKYANFSIIGGGFDKIGIHNIIEPAVYGVQTAFGPNHKNYEEAIELLNLGGATVYRNSNELKILIKNNLFNSENLVLKDKIKEYVKSNVFNNLKIVDLIRTTINY